MRYKKIKELREDNDLYQRQLADLLNVAQTTYSNYEIGERQIPIPALVKLAKFYNTSIDYILDLTEETTPYPRKNKDLKLNQKPI